tara:strand:+ start:32 stop:259 length:228 start_codon:yes stop_codon:yes gene_type:complete
MPLHKSTDCVLFSPNKNVWFDLEDKIILHKVPFMSSGKHIPRYEDQIDLTNVYLTPGELNIDKLVECLKKHNQLF